MEDESDEWGSMAGRKKERKKENEEDDDDDEWGKELPGVVKGGGQMGISEVCGF